MASSTHKKTLNKLRPGNHRLRIEAGRHTIPKTPENLRICSFCHLNEIENELHFILYCHLYDSERSNFFKNINKKYPHFIQLSNNEKIIFLFNSVDPHPAWSIGKNSFFDFITFLLSLLL